RRRVDTEREHVAVPVENLAAAGRRGHDFLLLPRGARDERVVLHHLEPEQPGFDHGRPARDADDGDEQATFDDAAPDAILREVRRQRRRLDLAAERQLLRDGARAIAGAARLRREATSALRAGAAGFTRSMTSGASGAGTDMPSSSVAYRSMRAGARSVSTSSRSLRLISSCAARSRC